MRLAIIIYFFLLTYVIAALFFWGHNLNKQSKIIYANELKELERRHFILPTSSYQEEMNKIQQDYNMRKTQYIGEGVVFLVVILIGAGIVYSSLRGQDKLNRQQHNFILSISHELKSPIAAIKLNLETLNRRKLSPEIQEKLINGSLKEAERLDDLSSNLLIASRLENRNAKTEYEKVNVSEVLEEAVSTYITRHGRIINTDIEEDCFCLSDHFLWKLAFNNLLENAIKYSPKEEAIDISLYKKDNNLAIAVADRGQGIPDEEKKRIFEQFYRVGNELSRKTKGTGLGLYLTSKIMEQFKGSISVKDNNPHGTIFEMEVPEYYTNAG